MSIGPAAEKAELRKKYLVKIYKFLLLKKLMKSAKEEKKEKYCKS